MADDNAQDNLHNKIRKINADETLSREQKTRMIQDMMTAKWRDSQENLLAGRTDEMTQRSLDVTYRIKDVYGCEHYYRGCKVHAPCCDVFYTCRLCHDANTDHRIDRYAIDRVWCMHCKTEQDFNGTCQNKECGKEFGLYTCEVCKFIDGDPEKEIFHCYKCGLCRVGNQDDYFHCDTCGACFSKRENDHTCMENKMAGDCSVCHEDMFSSTTTVTSLLCGHCMHTPCYNQFIERGDFKCPLCSKLVCESALLDNVWNAMRNALEVQPMPEVYADARAVVLCNDCEIKCTKPFHFLQLYECDQCHAFNTTVLGTENMPSAEQLETIYGGEEEVRGGEGEGESGDEAVDATVEGDVVMVDGGSESVGDAPAEPVVEGGDVDMGEE